VQFIARSEWYVGRRYCEDQASMSEELKARKAWHSRGYNDGLRGRPSGVEIAWARGGELAATAYAEGYRLGTQEPNRQQGNRRPPAGC